MDVALNDTCRALMGCLQPTPIIKICCLLGIAPLKIRRSVTTDWKKAKQLKDERTRLKSQHSFINSAMELKDPSLDPPKLQWQT